MGIYVGKTSLGRFWQGIKTRLAGKMDKSVYDSNSDGVVDNAAKVNNHTVASDVPANAKFTDTTYSSLSESEGSGTVSLVTRGEKYTWNRKANTSTTLSGYGITNAYTKSEVDTALSDKAEILDITVPISAGTGVLATVTDSRIKADYKVIGYNIVWDNPAAITSDIIVTTSNGSLTINGTCTSATEATFQIGKILDEIDETVVWEEMEEMG